MKILATVLMTSALLAGCSMPGTQRNNAVQGDSSEAKRSMQQQTNDMPARASDGSTGNMQRNNAIEGDKSEAKKSMQYQSSDMPARAADGSMNHSSGNTQRSNAIQGDKSQAKP